MATYIKTLNENGDIILPRTSSEAVIMNNGSSLDEELSGKITNPSSGSVGQVLKKTASGVEWGEVSGGSALYDHYIFISYSGSHPPSGFAGLNFHIVNTSNTSFDTFEGLRTYLYNNGRERVYTCNCTNAYGDVSWGLITANNSFGNNIVVTKMGDTYEGYEVIINNPPDEDYQVYDTVTQF